MIVDNYLTAIEVKLLTTPIVRSFTIVKKRCLANCGYFRARLILDNGDFLEIVEFFTIKNEEYVTETYRYQWMDKTKQILRKRWDNVEHFPDLPNFPHHVHISEESNVHPSQSLSIIEIIDIIAAEIQ